MVSQRAGHFFRKREKERKLALGGVQLAHNNPLTKAGIKLSKHLRVALASESCWADAELGAEGVIEIR